MNAPARLDAQTLLNPRAIVLVGASHDARKPGGVILRRLARSDRAYTFHAVNPLPLDVEGVIGLDARVILKPLVTGGDTVAVAS